MDVQRLSHCTPTASQQKGTLSRFSGSASSGLDGTREIEREDSLSLRNTRITATSPLQLDLVHIDLLAPLSIHILILRFAPILVELKVAVTFALLAIRVCLINLSALR